MLAGLLLAGCASKPKPGTTAGAPAPGTTTVHFRAFTSSGQLTVRVADVVRGQCWTTSIAAPGATAYRCFQGNKILDPCFTPARPTHPLQLACMQAPWSRALMLEVSGKLPGPGDGGPPSRPWALELANGVRCVASTGTVPAVGGVNLAYQCTNGGHAALVGPATGTLTARYAAPRATALRTLTVTTVWHA